MERSKSPGDRLIEFAATLSQPKEQRRHNVAAGAAIAAAGLPLAVGGARLASSAFRPKVGALLKKVGAPNLGANVDHAGKRIFDYIEGSQKALNTGIAGKLAGNVIRGSDKPGWRATLVPGELARAHYSSFRAGHKQAFTSLMEEIGTKYQEKAQAAKTTAEKVVHQAKFDEYLGSMGHALEHYDTLLNQGFNDREALAKVTSDPVHQPLMRRLIPKTTYAAPYAGIAGATAAVPIAAGGAVAATTRKDKRKDLQRAAIRP